MEKVEVTKKLNIDDYLYHGINAYFYEGYNSKIEEESEILRTILNNKFILSRIFLKDILEKDKWEILELKRTVEYYVKENSVSIYFTRNSRILDDFDRKYYLNPYWDNNHFFAYYSYKDKPSIILDTKLLKDLPRIYSKWIMPGEIQIENKIPDNYFVGIALPNINLNYLIEKAIDDSDATLRGIKEDLSVLSEEEFVRKYYQDVILFEKVLQETGSNLRLYHTETGEEIMSQSDEIKYIKELKYFTNKNK